MTSNLIEVLLEMMIHVGHYTPSCTIYVTQEENKAKNKPIGIRLYDEGLPIKSFVDDDVDSCARAAIKYIRGVEKSNGQQARSKMPALP